uniref:Uncharacterized protein n=1 Tax=Manihot esculenta TaxID=3983 RepID=A0A2C9WHM1_MANES
MSLSSMIREREFEFGSLRNEKPNGSIGEHRMITAIPNLQNEINFLQEELNQLEQLAESSIVCK